MLDLMSRALSEIEAILKQFQHSSSCPCASFVTRRYMLIHVLLGYYGHDRGLVREQPGLDECSVAWVVLVVRSVRRFWCGIDFVEVRKCYLDLSSTCALLVRESVLRVDSTKKNPGRKAEAEGCQGRGTPRC